MNDAWKIVQGLKRETQNNSFGRSDTVWANLPPLERSKYAEERAEIWGNLSAEQIFSNEDSEIEEVNVRLIRDYIKEQQKLGMTGNINMHIGGLDITIDKKNPEKITFKREQSLRMHGKYPYVVTIDKDDVYSEVDLLDRTSDAYTLEGDRFNLHRQVTIVAGEEISEFFQVELDGKSDIDEAQISQIIKSILEKNPQYQIGDQNEIFRAEISPEEVFNSKDELNGVHVGHNNGTGVHPRNINVYGEGFEVAQAIEEQCKYIYSVLMRAYKETPEIINDEDTEVVSENEVDTEQIPTESENSTYNGVNIEELDDAQLDGFIDEMSKKQEENAKRIERLQKLKKAKDLIALSKEQDKIIAELESQKETGGVDFGEQ